jgi:hypothetical protein
MAGTSGPSAGRLAPMIRMPQNKAVISSASEAWEARNKDLNMVEFVALGRFGMLKISDDEKELLRKYFGIRAESLRLQIPA